MYEEDQEEHVCDDCFKEQEELAKVSTPANVVALKGTVH